MIRFTPKDLDVILSEFLGKPYAKKGRGPDGYDCYGLVRAFMARLAVDLPEIGAVNPHEAGKVYERQQEGYIRLEWPRPWSLVTFCKERDLDAHIGVVLPNDNLFLHCPGRAAGKVIAEPLSRKPWRDSVDGYWWPKGWLEVVLLLSPMSPKRRAWQFVRAGRTLKEIIEQDITEGRDIPIQAFLDGQLAEDWSIVPTETQQLVIRPELAGGKQALSMGGMIAMTLLAPGMMAGANTGLGLGLKAGSFAYNLGQAAIAMTGALAFNALIGANEAKRDPSQVYDWQAATTQRVGSFVPLVYGTYGVKGNIICSYSTSTLDWDTNIFDKNDYVQNAANYYWLKIAYSDGPIDGVVDGSEKVNDRDLESYDLDEDDDFTIEHFRGTDDQEASSIDDAFEVQVNVLCDPDIDSGAVESSFNAIKADRVGIVLHFPNGFCDATDDGDYKRSSVEVKIEVREEGGSWHTISNETIYGETKKPLRVVRFLDETYTGGSSFSISEGTQYEVKVTRLDSRHHDKMDDFYFDSIQFYFASNQRLPGLAYTAIGALASDDITGSIDYFAVVKGKLVRVYDDVAETWSIEWSDNPAWIAFDLLTRPVISGNGDTVAYSVEYYRRLDPSYLVLDDFVAFADWCDELVDDGKGGTEKRYVFNGVFDSEMTAWDAACRVCQMACAAPVFEGHRVGVVIDKPATPTQMFCVSNMREGFSETWLDTSEAATEYDVEFADETADYGVELYTVPRPGLDYQVPASMDGFGHTKRSQVWRRATRDLRVNQYMQRTVEIPAVLDAIYCKLGDVVYVQHPAIQNGTGGRITEVYADGVLLDKPVELGYYDTGQDPTSTGYLSTDGYGLVFDAKAALTLGLCTVKAQSAGTLTVRVKKWISGTGATGDVIAERTFSVPAGESEIDLNIGLEANDPGEYYILYRSGTLALERSDIGSFSGYDFENIQLVGGSATTLTTTNTYYYFFFNLHVRNPLNDHALLVRTHDGTAERLSLYEVAAVMGDDDDVVVISGTWEYTPNENDLFVFGEETKVIDLYRIKGFERTGDGRVLIQGTQYTTDYYTDDEEPPKIEAQVYSETKGGKNPSLLPSAAAAVAISQQPQSSSVDTVSRSGLTFTGDSVDTVTWECTGDGIKYQGVWCPIEDDAVGTTSRYIYFDPAIGDPRYLQATDDLSILAGQNRYLMCINIDGVPHPKDALLIGADGAAVDADDIDDGVRGIKEFHEYFQDPHNTIAKRWTNHQPDGLEMSIEAGGASGDNVLRVTCDQPFPVAQWQMNDNAADTDVEDATGNGHDGTASHNTSTMTVTGKVGSALEFITASSRYVGVPDHADLRLTGGGTICMWVKWDGTRTTSGGYSPTLVAHGSVYRLFVSSDGGALSMYINWGSGGDYFTVSNAGALVSGTWRHIAVVFTATEKKIYADGVDVTQTAGDSRVPSEQAIATIIGAMTVGGGFFGGQIDDVRVYDTGLTQEQIQDIIDLAEDDADESINGEALLTYGKSVPFDPGYLYRVRARIRATSGDCLCSLGLAGRNAGDTAWVNASGSDSLESQHMVVAVDHEPASSWQVVTGYISGQAAAGDSSECSDPEYPGVMHSDVRWWRPIIRVDFQQQAGVFEIDEFNVDVMPPTMGSIRPTAMDYEAVGDGVTDDTVAIQTYFDDCVANNRPAILPKGAAGIYKISSTITVGDGSTVINGFTMQGEGWESVKFLWAGGTSDNMIEFTSCTGLTLDNIAIDGNDTAGVNGIYHTTGASAASQHTTLRNCQIRRCKGVGYHVKQWSSTATCDYLTFHNCELAYNGTGLKVEGGVRQVDFFGGGILVSDSFGVHIVDGVVHFYDITFALNGPAYTTGTATFTNGSASITGSGTSWTSAMEGCRIRLDADGAWYTVQTVTDATHLTLTASYADTGGSGAYMIAPHPNTADIYLEGPISSFQIHGGTTESLKLLRGDWANDAGWSGLVAQNIIIGLNQSHNEAIGGASAIDVFIDYDCPKPLHLIGVKAMGDIALGSKCAAVWDYQTDFWNWERLPTDANPLTGFTGNTTVVNHFGYTDPTINPRQMVNTLLLGRGRVMIAADTWMNGIDLLSVEGTVYRRMGFADSAPETPYANEGWIVFNVSPATNDEPLGWVCTESGNPATSTNAIFEAFGTNLIGATITDFARDSILTCDDESDLAAALGLGLENDTWLSEKTVAKTIDVDAGGSEDYKFDNTQENTTKQTLALTDILPAYAELTGFQIRCFETVTGSTAMQVDLGTSNGGTELGTGSPDSNGDLLYPSTGSAPLLTPTNAARTLYLSGTPGANWSTLSAGRWVVMLSYKDYAGIYSKKVS